jgi:hypothetical protein
MKKPILLFAVALFVATAVHAQPKIAILDFRAGVGVTQADVNGLSQIFVTYFIEPARFTLVERSQINQVITEQGFQSSSMTQEQMVRIGQILNLSKIVVGDINVVVGQYNVDVRVVDVQSGIIEATDGATWLPGSSYRELMSEMADRLKNKMFPAEVSSDTNAPSQTVQYPDGITINGVTWATRNVGASGRFMDSPVDRSPYYDWEDAQNACPVGWRLPTKNEIESLLSIERMEYVQYDEYKRLRVFYGNDSSLPLIFVCGPRPDSDGYVTPEQSYWISDYYISGKTMLITGWGWGAGNQSFASVRCVRE